MSMNIAHHTRPFRWLFLFWIGVTYIWGVWGITTVSGLCQGKLVLFMYGLHPNLKDPLLMSNLFRAGIFTPLMILYGMLFWLGLSGRINDRLYWLYFLLEGGIALTCSLALNQMNIALSLYLALVLAAIVMVRQPRRVLGVTLGCIVLFLLALLWEITPLSKGSQSTLYWEVAIGMFPSYLATVLFIVCYILLYLQQTRARAQLGLAYDELATAHLQLTFSAERIAELTKLTERQRLARELHDTLAQGAAGLLMQLEAIRAGLTFQRYTEALEMVEQSLTEARSTLLDVRDAIADLRANDISPSNLAEMVQQEVERLSSGAEFACHVEPEGLACVPASLCEQVLRMIVEGLTNIARHAQATKAWVTTSLVAGILEITIGDDGVGFDDSAETVRDGHYGLLGLRERTRLIGGECVIDSAPGKGTVLYLRVPIDWKGNGCS